MEYIVKNFTKELQSQDFSSYVLGIDIGGTNTNIGIAGVKNNKPILQFSLNYKSTNLTSLIPAIKNTISYAKNNFDINVDFACIGAAGVVSKDKNYVKLTNLNLDISSTELIRDTSLKSVYILNDFQTIGYGLNFLDTKNGKDIINIKPGKEYNNSVKAIIGAGTGLGKCILIYDKNYNAYVPYPSEGGHSDFPVYTEQEMNLVNFIKKLRGITDFLSYEELLSGRGIEGIYLFLRNEKEFKKSEYTDEIDNSNNKIHLISKYKLIDETCNEVFRLFAKFFARCAKNFVLDSLAIGGLYIAGGIALKHRDIFENNDFIYEFVNGYQRKDLLKSVPINIINNYDVSLYGACYAAICKYLIGN